MAEEAPLERLPGLRTTRMEAFSDGVFAIAITLLVLEISVPANSEDDLLGAFFDEWQSYLAYVVSFATIGAMWYVHSAVTEFLEAVNSMLVRINLLLLMVVSFIPFPTRLIAEYGGDDEAGRVATTIYGLTILLSSVLMALFWRYAVQARLVRPETPDEVIRAMTTRLTPTPAGYIVMIGLGLLLPIIAVFGYLVLALLIIVPFGLLRHRGAA